jgi:hypothetical protein
MANSVYDAKLCIPKSNEREKDFPLFPAQADLSGMLALNAGDCNS